ncbi:ROK family transcriptional regulator [Thermotoga sp. KOL6]|uniref:ROK family transcriptional regulator n=1 Tax=Thermotoga sp. KOL6 TaxID=126741 RepID=UPI000C75AC01|nr:ROK family transcriptional regulator [Thermotoga sp. KOL6]PLV59141.1 ArsR family transcriptional regulator [Thermotoga sp. KOL6]
MLNELERTILQILKDRKNISRIDISRKLGISKPVVSKAVNKLINLGFVKETGKKESSSRGGRRPILLSFVPRNRYVVGVDIGGTKIDAILTDLNGTVLRKEHKNLPEKIGKEHLFEEIVNVIDPFLREDKVLGIGIGIPGTVDEKGFVKRLPAFGVMNWDLRHELERRTGLPVLIENNANLDAFSESRIGAGKGFKCVLLISIGWGIGAGMVYNGEIFRGAKGKAGEFGHIVTDWVKERKRVPEKGFGHLEEWFSGFSLKRKFGEIEPNEVFDQHFSDLKEGIEHLGVAIANAVVLVDPDVVIIKGGIGFHQFEKIEPIIKSVLENTVPKDILEDVVIKKGEIEEYGVAIGGALFVIKNILGLV